MLNLRTNNHPNRYLVKVLSKHFKLKVDTVIVNSDEELRILRLNLLDYGYSLCWKRLSNHE